MLKFPNTFPTYLQPISMDTLLTWSINNWKRKELQVYALFKWSEASREKEGTKGEQRKGGHLPRRWLFDPFNLCGLPTDSVYWLQLA